MAQIILSGDGQIIEVPDDIARSDQLLKRALAPHYPDLANAKIEREEKNGLLKVTLSKQAGPKGSTAVVEPTNPPNTDRQKNVIVLALDEAPTSLNPALALAWKLAPLDALPLTLGSERNQGVGGISLEERLNLQKVIKRAIEKGEAEALKITKTIEMLNAAPAVPALQVPLGF
jgi:hypothetical protein